MPQHLIPASPRIRPGPPAKAAVQQQGPTILRLPEKRCADARSAPTLLEQAQALTELSGFNRVNFDPNLQYSQAL